jgi:NAD+ kinase
MTRILPGQTGKANKDKFQKIGVIIKMRKEEAVHCLERLLPVFEGIKGLSLTVETGESKKDVKLPKSIKRASADKVVSGSDIVFSIGGDGTILRCARYLFETNSWKDTGLVGINAGHLGFLSTISAPEANAQVESVLTAPKECRMQARSCLEVIVRRNGKEYKRFDALNDAVLSSGSLSRLISFDVEVNGEFLSAYRSDGLIVSTPTGSTGYNLAAGGSIIEPSSPIVQLTPICPQSFSNRPIVISDKNHVKMRLPKGSRNAYLTLDGQFGIEITAKDEIEVYKSSKAVYFVMPPKLRTSHYFSALRQKLKWGLVSSTSA